MARSIHPIVSQEHAVTRCAVTNEKDLEKERTMGRKFTIPYGLYRMHGFVNGSLAEQTGFSSDDLSLLWQALTQMFDHDRSASRGEMSACKLLVFEHDSKLGNAPARRLFDAVDVKLKDSSKPPRSFDDYDVLIEREAIPDCVTLHEML